MSFFESSLSLAVKASSFSLPLASLKSSYSSVDGRSLMVLESFASVKGRSLTESSSLASLILVEYWLNLRT